jgi:hypothetical protein
LQFAIVSIRLGADARLFKWRVRMIKLGSKVKDEITGLSGIVTGYVTYLSGCNQALVVPKAAADGTFKDDQWFDDQRLELDNKFKPIVLDNSKTPGADVAAPKR